MIRNRNSLLPGHVFLGPIRPCENLEPFTALYGKSLTTKQEERAGMAGAHRGRGSERSLRR